MHRSYHPVAKLRDGCSNHAANHSDKWLVTHLQMLKCSDTSPLHSNSTHTSTSCSLTPLSLFFLVVCTDTRTHTGTHHHSTFSRTH